MNKSTVNNVAIKSFKTVDYTNGTLKVNRLFISGFVWILYLMTYRPFWVI